MFAERITQENRSDRDIKRAFLHILSRKRLVDITITEVAREAHVSRTTFYMRFGNLANLYAVLVKDMLTDTILASNSLTCAHCQQRAAEMGALTFCDALRGKTVFSPLVKENRFLSTVTDNPDCARELINSLLDRGFDYRQAYAVFVFHMGGCFAAATLSGCPEPYWPKVRTTIDRLLLGGIDGLVSHTM